LVARYTPSRRYLSFALGAVAGTLLAAWIGLRWSPAWIAAALFAISALGVSLLALRPPIEIHETHLQIGRRAIAWSEVGRLDQTGWNAPLAVHLTLMDDRRIVLVYPGDLDSCVSLLRHLRRYSREALLDGVPYRQFWGEPPAAAPKQLPPPKYRLLRPEDEEEVERMLQRLKSVGRLDPRGSDEK
jgi:hypothetical protein